MRKYSVNCVWNGRRSPVVGYDRVTKCEALRYASRAKKNGNTYLVVNNDTNEVEKVF